MTLKRWRQKRIAKRRHEGGKLLARGDVVNIDQLIGSASGSEISANFPSLLPFASRPSSKWDTTMSFH